MGDNLKKIYILLLLLLMFLPIKSYAKYEVIDARCTDSLKASLKSDANDVVYRLSKVINGEDVTYKAIFYNLTKNMYLSDIDNNAHKGNTIENLKPGSTIQVIIYASNNTYCEGYKIVTKIINVPYYNKYSKYELCNGYENYFLCKENSNVNLTEKEFETKMKDYINTLNTKEEEVEPEKEDIKFNIIDFIIEYKYLFIGGISLIAITTLIVIINNKKKNRGIL